MTDRIDRIKHAAEGRWPDVFTAAGMDASHFARQNRPCPLCGGRDRFSFFPKKTDGHWFCRGCGTGDGIELVKRFTKKSFPETLEFIERNLGLPLLEKKRGRRSNPTERSGTNREAALEQKRREALEALWRRAKPLSTLAPEAPLRRYLRARGLDGCVPSGELRFVDSLECWEAPEPRTGEASVDAKAELAGRFPAMVARLTDSSGTLTTLHRTYLTEDGRKAPVRAPKKLAAGAVGDGLIRLYPAGDMVCLAEGIETALSVHVLTGLPVWSVVSLVGLKRFGLGTIPENVHTVRIFGDNDRSYAGAAGAYELAARLRRERPELEVTVHIPEMPGADWNDVLLAGGSLKL